VITELSQSSYLFPQITVLVKWTCLQRSMIRLRYKYSWKNLSEVMFCGHKVFVRLTFINMFGFPMLKFPSTFFLNQPVYGSEHDVAQAPIANGLGRVFGFVGVKWRRRLRRLDGAEPAASSAGVTHQHDRGRRSLRITSSPAKNKSKWIFNFSFFFCLFISESQDS
jgi:hypothetical protein